MTSTSSFSSDVGDVEVGEHVLHVVIVLERLDDPQHPARLVGGGDRHEVVRDQRRVRRLDREAGVLERLADLEDRRRLGGHRPRVAVAGDVVGAGVEGGEHQLVLVRRAVDLDDPAPAELPAHRPRLGERAAELGEHAADLGAGAVAVVGEHVDQQGDAARARSPRT